jgi:hypothetical protein
MNKGVGKNQKVSSGAFKTEIRAYSSGQSGKHSQRAASAYLPGFRITLVQPFFRLSKFS